MTDRKALIERLRADWPEILVEKHWMMDSDAIEEQRREAADAIEELDRHLTLSGKVNKALSERIEKLEADITQLQVDSEPSPYCPICGSCGEEGCCGDKRCLYPDTGLTERIAELEADNARLREALEGVVAFGERHPGHGYSCATIARAALQETSHDA